jgi:molybdate transport system substrate-binding protein
VKDKTVLTTGGPAGELVADGRVELGVQQVTELLPVKGISMLGSLPKDIQVVTIYSAAVLLRSMNRNLAADFLAFVTGPKVAQIFSDAGFGRY